MVRTAIKKQDYAFIQQIILLARSEQDPARFIYGLLQDFAAHFSINEFRALAYSHRAQVKKELVAINPPLSLTADDEAESSAVQGNTTVSIEGLDKAGRIAMQSAQSHGEVKHILIERTPLPLNQSLLVDIAELAFMTWSKMVMDEQLSMYELILQHTYNSIEITDNNAILEYVNPAFEKITMYDQEEVIGKTVASLLRPPDSSPALYQEIKNCLDKGEIWKGIYQAIRKNQASWVSNSTIIPFIDTSGKISKHIAIKQDISYQVEQSKREQISEHKFQCILQATSDPIFVHDLNGRFYEINDAACKRLGYSRQELLNFHVWDIETAIKPHDLNTMWQALAKEPLNISGEHRRKDGTYYPVEITLSRFSIGDEKMILAMARDVTEKNSYEARLKHQATIDSLTHLPNRFYGIHRLEQILLNTPNSRVALFFLDLDSFKKINDSLGHAIGDHHLAEVAKRLSQALRKQDVIARLGGDEFMLIISYQNEEEMIEVANKILTICSLPVQSGEYELITTASIGIALAPEHGIDAKTMMSKADSAMYRSKQRGRNCWTIYDNHKTPVSKQMINITAEVVKAFAQDQLTLIYQPIVKLSSEKIIGSEALLRWEHPRLGKISPEQTILAAEESGIIHQLGLWIIRKACEQLKFVQAIHSELFMTINVSPQQLNNALFAESVLAVIHDCQLEPRTILLEITENALIVQSETLLKQLNILARSGIQCTIDDFGTGYSSLNYLQKYPFKCLKIDKCFVQGVPGNENDVHLIKSILNIGTSFNLKIIAEGVEIKAQADTLKELSCPYAQGHFYYHPLSSAEFIAVLSDNKNRQVQAIDD